ncbi:hypothetical protein [Coleofasciculus sp.]|uniref:hypothetical protein n=1 Tax=Coleofasciculus sp. TaxID=3100458 RepID=UPI003A453072
MVQIPTKGLTLAEFLDLAEVLAYPANQQPRIFQEPDQVLPTPEFIGNFKLSVGELFGWLKPGNI